MTRLLRSVAIFLVVAGMFVIAADAGAAGTVEISTDPFDSPSPFQHMTEVEPHVFTSGSTVVAAFQQGRYPDGGCTDIGFATSTDSGVSWKHGSLPGLTRFVGGDRYDNVSDPAVAYNAAFGIWLVVTLPVGGPAAVFISRSADGLAWDFPITAASGGSFYDKTWIACDNSESSPFFGNCYIEWDEAFEGNLILMSTSTDGGATWSEPATTADSANGLGGQPLVQPGGRVAVPYRGFSYIGSFVSDDGGASWSESVQISEFSEHTVAGDLRAVVLPSAAIDGDGTIYVAWSDCRFRPGCGANDIVISTSSDGLRWSSPSRVPIEAATGTGDHFIPGLGADRNTFAPDVSLALVYYYYPQANCSSTSCRLIAAWVTSADGGRSWSAPIDLTEPMALDWLADTNQGRMVGDYLGANFTADGVAHPVFAGAVEPNEQFFESMFSTCVDCPASASPRLSDCVGADCATRPESAEANAPSAEVQAAKGLQIAASTYTVNIGGLIQLQALGSSKANATIAWSVEEGELGGTVSASGVYRAPVRPGTYHVIANDGVERARAELRVFTVR